MSDTKLFSVCVRPWAWMKNAGAWAMVAENVGEIEVVYGWTRRAMAQRAKGMYLLFPAESPFVGWDRMALDLMARCNEPMQINEESSPMFEMHFGRNGKTCVMSRAKAREPHIVTRWYRRLFPRRAVVMNA